MKYLGHIVSEKGIQCDPDKTDKIKNWPVPKTLKEVRSFLGLASYYRRFIRDFSKIASPLFDLTKKNNRFFWDSNCQRAFDTLKKFLAETVVLQYPDFSKPFILDCDASDRAVGSVLSQIGSDGLERVVAYYSTTHTPQEINYSTTRKELLAIIKSIKHFKHYLYGRKFTVRTDHGSITWLRNFKEPHGQVARWIEFLATYDIDFEYRAGPRHQNADALSRYPGVAALQTTGFNLGEIRKAQQEDPDIHLIIEFLGKYTEKPPFSEVSAHSSVVKTYWNMWEQLELKDNILYRKWFRLEGDSSLLIIVPDSLKSKILSMAHDSPTAGHLGVRKTVFKVRQQFYWVNLQSDVLEWIKSCPTCCARKNPPRMNRAELENIRVGEPLERVGMDITGPFPVTKYGNKYILVVMDYFTKWVEAYPIPDQESSTVARCLVNNFISRFGIPKILLTDRGSNFESKLFQQLCQLLGIYKTRTTAYHPMTDGLVEKMNNTLKNVIASYIDEGQTDWDEWLPLALMAIRSSVQETTGMTPNKLMFGREINIPLTLMYEELPSIQSSHLQFIADLQKKLGNTFRQVRENMKSQQRRQKVNYDLRQSGKPYKEDDLVWLFTPRKKKGLSPKLQKLWSGPFRIVKKLSDANYVIQKEGSLVKQVVHFNRLKIFHVPHPSRIVGNSTNIPQPCLDDELEGGSDSGDDDEGGVLNQTLRSPLPSQGRRRRLPRRFQDYLMY